jgi:hypothetical protein
MKKNFFKKLASVTALALVVTSVAPSMATTAAAAKAPSLNVTSKTLYVGKKFDINVKNKPTTATYTWSTSNKAVATVAKGGIVTAKKAGTATIKLVVKTKSSSKTLKATFTIKESAASVKISNPTEKVKVGTAVYDFNRTVTTKSGGKATDKTFWVITDNTAGATVDANGVVSTTKAGEFKIQAVTATSKANFDAGKTTAVSEVLTVKVPFAVVSAKPSKLNQVAITINSEDATITAKDIIIVKDKVKQPVKSISLSTDKKTIYADLYSDVVDKGVYSVSVKGSDAVDFTATVGTITQIVLNDQVVAPGTASAIAYNVYDENGLDITSKYSPSTLSWTSTTAVADGKVTLLKEGDAAFVTVSYTKYDTLGNKTEIKSAQAKVLASNAVVSSLTTWTVQDSTLTSKAAFDKALATTVALKDESKSIFVKAKDSKNNDVITGFTFESLDPNTLVVTSEGKLYPIKTGTADVKIKKGDYVTYVTVTVTAERKATSIKADKNDVKVSSTILETETVKFNIVDQNGSNFTTASGGAVEVTAFDGKDVAAKIDVVKSVVAADGSFTVSFKPQTTDVSGTARYYVKANDITTVVYVTAVKAGNTANYVVTASKTEVDSYTNGDDVTVAFNTYAVDANGVKREAATATYAVKNASGSTVATGSSVVVATKTKENLSAGTYTVEATINNAVYTTSFTVKSTRPAATATLVAAYPDVTKGSSIQSAVQNNIKVTLADGTVLTNGVAKFIVVDPVNGDFFKNETGTVKVFVKTIEATYNGFTYTVDVNAQLVFNVK